jgi:muramoyltetrapeptide carboxypeptidase
VIRPPRLREGARVALVAPAGPVTEERIAAAHEQCERLGVEPVLGRHVRSKYAAYLAGSDAARLADLQWALTEPGIDAAWALRGGYGTMRLLPALDLAPVVAAPRAFIGFSDNTAVHLALYARGVVAFHAPHAGGEMTDMALHALRAVLWTAAPVGALELPAGTDTATLCAGVAEGPLIGGNLTLLAATCGTSAQATAAGAVLFVEEIGEEPYRIDRAWTQLVLSGVLDGVAGIVFGHFTDCGRNADDVRELQHRLVAPFGVPAVAGLPIGHQADNWTLPLGVRARLDARSATLALTEPAVS